MLKATLKKTRIKPVARFLAVKRDLANRINYGPYAPQFAELIWLHPDSCNEILENDLINNTPTHELTGKVVTNIKFFENSKHVSEYKMYQVCKRRWIDKKSWEESGLYEIINEELNSTGRFDVFKDFNEILKRYEVLDDIFYKIEREMSIRTRKSLNKNVFRESGGILVHVGPNGKPYFKGNGHHRFYIAHLLSIPFPAQLGCVHISALPSIQYLRKFTQPKIDF